MIFCENCLAPSEEKKCNECEKLEKDPLIERYISGEIFNKELSNFLSNKKEILFAFSGGKDSVAVLHLLNIECKKRDIKLNLFTIDHGFKGKKTIENIKNVLEFEGLSKNHTWIDITKRKLQGKCNVKEYYADLFKQNIIPCGQRCNKIIDTCYKEILKEYNQDVLVTGGDTPKFNENLGRFSIFWEKPSSSIKVLRGGVAFGLSKNKNSLLIRKYNIPWKNPECGGNDTDCLLPGAVYKRIAQKGLSLEEAFKKFPNSNGYFSERVRWKIIEKEYALEKLKNLDKSSDECFEEMMQILSDNKET